MYVPVNLMRYDFAFQTSLIVLNALLTVCVPFNFGFLFMLLYFQLMVGVFQFLSALVHYFRPQVSPDIQRMRGTHLVLSIVFLLFLASLMIFDVVDKNPLGLGNYGVWAMFWAIVLVIPQLFAYSYYYIMRIDYRARRNYIEKRINIA